MKTKPKRILLHSCCAICASGILKQLLAKGFSPTLFFYNPNIWPKNEYQKRKKAIENLAKIFSLKLEVGKYEPEKWFEKIKRYQKEKEGGKRCKICFCFRLSETVNFAKDNSFPFFSTTLIASPYKSEKIITKIAKNIAGQNISFISFKELEISKERNWQLSNSFAKKYNFYRQKYCGCLFSIRKF